MTEQSVTHASLIIERLLDAPAAKVYQAFADQTAKEKWFKGPDDSAPDEHRMDFREGGRESNSGTFHGTVHRFEATYYDIVPDERIVYAYEMYLNDERISVSLATLEFTAEANGTRLTLTENGVFLDGLDTVESRRQGTEQLLDALAASLRSDL